MSNPNEVLDVDKRFYICLNCSHKMRRSSFYDSSVHEPCDKCGEVHIERYAAVMTFVAQQNAALLRELQSKQEFNHETGWAIPASILEAKAEELEKQ